MMRRSQYFIPTLKENPAEAQVASHRLLLRAGMIRQVTAGVYNWLPLGLRVLRNAENIIREEMNAAGAHEIFMPIVQPITLWEETGRDEKYGPELVRFLDRHDAKSCLGPTHEEVVTDIYRKNVKSYKDLPLNLYQIQTKFRDEIRPRFGLMRGREFVMKDAYSFDVDKNASLEEYENMVNAYKRIFDRMGLKWRKVTADSGSIGGNHSHEFQVLAATGEDDLLFDPDSDYAVNIEKYDPATAPKPREELEEMKGIEVGHCFHLGTIYSEPMKAMVKGEDGKDVPVMMGCYGIGVSRIVAAAIEQNHDDNGIIWPKPLAPFDVILINMRPNDETCTKVADALYAKLTGQGVDVLYDDRDVSPGVKFAEADLLGLPHQAVIGPKGLEKGIIEWKIRETGETTEHPKESLPW